ncbi:hypothetical protein GMRT_15535 [Giardia muris]|uniref:Uncharacterized protein n=1 Tax=Giardia muris TaxID=5742 RepID=A0A4Z1T4E8_GIAMU|nr:hypothetical protein GMRT_15535 [Giardia muris]|eukprot:TNJ28873.1 hypothetical protein GMRT_15535 [Giardia muris]
MTTIPTGFDNLARRAETVLARSASLTGKRDAAPMQRESDGALQPLIQQIDDFEQALIRAQVSLGGERLKYLLSLEASDLKAELHRERADGRVAVCAALTPLLNQLTPSFTSSPTDNFHKKAVSESEPIDRRGQLRAADDAIATALLEIRHPNLFHDAAAHLTAVSREDFGRRVVTDELPIGRLCAAYQLGREIERRHGLSLCSCYLPHSTDAPDEALEFRLLAEPAPSIEQDMQRRHLTRSKEHVWTLAVHSEVSIQLSLFTRLFVAHLLTLTEGASTADIVRIDIASVVKKVQACVQKLLAELACTRREAMLCLSIFCSCGRIPSEDFALIYEGALPVLEALFSTLSLTRDSLGFRLLQNAFQRELYTTLEQVLEESLEGMSLDAAVRQAREISFQTVGDALVSWLQKEVSSIDKLSQHFFLYRYDDKVSDSGVRASLDTLLSHAIPGLFAALRYLYRIPTSKADPPEPRSDRVVSSKEFYRHLLLLDILSTEAYFPEFLVSLDDLEGYIRREKEAAERDLDFVKERVQRLERQLRRDFPSVTTDGDSAVGRVYTICRTWRTALTTSTELLVQAVISSIALYVHNYLLDAMSVTDGHRGSWSSNTHSLDAVLGELLRLAEEHGVSGLLENPIAPRKHEKIKQGYKEAKRRVKEAEESLSKALRQLNTAGMIRGLLEDTIALDDAASQAPERVIALDAEYQELLTTLPLTPDLPSIEINRLDQSPSESLGGPVAEFPKLLAEFDASLATCLEGVVRELDILQPQENHPALSLTRRVDLFIGEMLGTTSLFGSQSYSAQNECDGPEGGIGSPA